MSKVIRYDINPEVTYRDGRIQSIVNEVTRLAGVLTSYNPAAWDNLITKILECYIDEIKAETEG